MAVNPKSGVGCPGDEKTSLSPEVEKRVDTDLVIVLVALWEERKAGSRVLVSSSENGPRSE